jgi:hypothetical protein
MKIMLDSGAYGAWKRGTHLDLNDYIAFIKQYEPLLNSYINLDLIKDGGQPDELEQAAAKSYANLQIMKDAGLSPIPVFHQGESFKWLERMLLDGENYIALAAHKQLGHRTGCIDQQDLVQWLDDCFTIVSDGNGRPSVRVHGLALTATSIVQRFPWTTVDSTTWLQQGGFGQITIPRYTNGKPNFALPPILIGITERSSRMKHFDTMKDWERDRVHRWLSEIGIDIEQAIESAEHRWRIRVAYFVGLQRSCNVEIVFGMNTDRRQRQILVEGGATHLLLSYFVLRQQTAKKIDAFLRGVQI